MDVASYQRPLLARLQYVIVKHSSYTKKMNPSTNYFKFLTGPLNKYENSKHRNANSAYLCNHNQILQKTKNKIQNDTLYVITK